MGNDLTEQSQPAQVERMLDSLLDLLKTPDDTPPKMMEIVQTLTKPCRRDWLQAEIAKVLVHYFAGADLGVFAQSLGDDYDHELSKYPAWAITKARRWWTSAANKNRHRKPLPGDLAERAELMMTAVKIAKDRLDRLGVVERQNVTSPEPEQPEKVSAERAAEMAAEFKRVVGGTKMKGEPT